MGICNDNNDIVVDINNFSLNKNLKEKNLIDFQRSYICKIKSNEKDFGFGFFCKIILPNKNKLPAIFLFHYIDQNEIIEIKNLVILFENKKSFNLNLNSNRKIYSYKDLNITIIELIKNSDPKYFLELSDDLNKNHYNIFHIKKNNHIIMYSLNAKEYEFRIIKKINKDNKHNKASKNDKGNANDFLLNIYDIKFGIIINYKHNKIIGMIINGKNIFINEAILNFINNSESNINNNNISKKNEIRDNDEIITNQLINKNYINEYLNDSINNNLNKELNDNNSKKNYFYIKSLLISFYLIKKVKNVFKNNDFQNKHFSLLISIFIKNYSENNYSQCDIVISDLLKKINEENNNILQNLNFEQLFDFILNKLHIELNKKKNNKNRIIFRR